jgi:hypothetical protein
LRRHAASVEVASRAIEAVVADIDDLALLITGDRTFFHFKAHSASRQFERRET